MARTARPKKSTSLTELGYTIKPTSKTDQEAGWVYHIKGTAPEFIIKKTKRGRLSAYKSRDAKIESTVEGLYNFKEKNGDLVGQRFSTPKASSPKLVEKTA